MRIAWGLVVVAMLGCGDKKAQQDKGPIVREVDLDEVKAAERAPEPAPVAATVDDALLANQDKVAPPPAAECVDKAKVVSWDPAKLRACFDSNEDDAPDRCVTWRRDGKVTSIDTEFAVEDADAKEPPPPPVEYRSDTDNNDEDRITVGDNSIEICPYEHACLRIMPRTDNGEVLSVLTDRDYKRGVFLMKDGDDKPAFEIWDLVAGRLRTHAPIKRIVEGETYEFSARLGSGTVIGFAEDAGGRAFGSVFSLDGAPRGDLAGGSRNLDLEKTVQHAGVFGIVDIGPEDQEKPYVLHLVSLATGAAIGKVTIKREDGGDGDLDLDPLPNSFVGITQFGTQLRLDVLDLRSRTTKVFFAPGC